MEYRYMGKTGLQLSVLSFGSWVSFHKQIDDSIADELMGIAYDNGVNFFDNAEVYALGESEKKFLYCFFQGLLGLAGKSK
jgi:aryl-alcohol dehydrogenase-like predicted oxidoreductase